MIIGILATLLLVAIIVVVIVATRGGSDDSDDNNKRSSGTAEERVMEILDRVPLIDGHNDLPFQLRTRLRNQLSQVN